MKLRFCKLLNYVYISILGVSVSTVKRCKKEYGIEIDRSASDEDLQQMVSATLARQPSASVVILQADLRAQHMWVPRKRIGEALFHIDQNAIQAQIQNKDNSQKL